jgi:triosephosphate isomerase (TIM)
MRQKLVVGNWKMNGSRAANEVLLEALKAPHVVGGAQVAVCVPAPYLADVSLSLKNSGVVWGAQDCSAFEAGAYTGEVSAGMLMEFGCTYVLVGHSERRAQHGESDAMVADKAAAALAHRMTPIVCVGETLAERAAGLTDEVVKRQLSAVIQKLGSAVSEVVVAYEPVWAIGTGKTATPQQAQAVHQLLRAQLMAAVPTAGNMLILYGGSVKSDNAAVLFAQSDIDGGLVGGASLNATEFLAICHA